jgi:hypothetical protein
MPKVKELVLGRHGYVSPLPGGLGVLDGLQFLLDNKIIKDRVVNSI